MRHLLPVLLALLPLGACAPGAPPSAPAPQPDTAVVAEPPAPLPPAVPAVWTVREGVRLDTGGGAVRLPRALMRLDVMAVDTAGYRVLCRVCEDDVEGMVAVADVATPALSPLEAAEHGGIVEFALAVRHAASLRDVEALRPVMDALFMYSFETEGGRVEALARWAEEGYRALDRVAALVDRGVVPRRDGSGAPRDELWLAPHEFRDAPSFPQLRTGFRRLDGRWTWAFLVGPG